MKVINIVGARTNFIRNAPFIREMSSHKTIELILVHAGHHYDVKMAGNFFEDLGIPEPNVSLEVGSGTHAFRTAEVVKRLEPVMG